MNIEQVLSYLSPLVLASLGWAWRIDNRVTAMVAQIAADQAAAKAEYQRELHALERRAVSADAFSALETRIEKRLDSIDRKLDRVLNKENAQ